MVSNSTNNSYKKGYLKVSKEHKLYFELYGNPKGIPILFLHGGPGSGFSEKNKKFFDKRKHNVIFFDQRGASRSKPFGSIKNNTTRDLVNDINKLLDHLKFEKVFIFGGSWGSTLALVYSINNPSRVLGLILYGIFLANKYAINHYIRGGIKEFFPEVWSRFNKPVPKRKDPVDFYLRNMLSNDKKKSEKFSYEWAYYEMSFLKLEKNKNLDKMLKKSSYKSLAILEAHYMKNNCFLSENYILKNTDKIRDIKTAIVHGRYDFICPPKQAFELHSKLSNAKLNIVTAGHSGSENVTKKLLKSEIKRITKGYKG